MDWTSGWHLATSIWVGPRPNWRIPTRVAIHKALTLAERSGERNSLPELYRVKAELIIKAAFEVPNRIFDAGAQESNQASSALVQAQAIFAEALAIAKKQQTRSWQLRVLMSMECIEPQGSKLLGNQLAESYGSFAEGHETADLKRAKMMLDNIPAAATQTARN